MRYPAGQEVPTPEPEDQDGSDPDQAAERLGPQVEAPPKGRWVGWGRG